MLMSLQKLQKNESAIVLFVLSLDCVLLMYGMFAGGRTTRFNKLTSVETAAWVVQPRTR